MGREARDCVSARGLNLPALHLVWTASKRIGITQILERDLKLRKIKMARRYAEPRIEPHPWVGSELELRNGPELETRVRDQS